MSDQPLFNRRRFRLLAFAILVIGLLGLWIAWNARLLAHRNAIHDRYDIGFSDAENGPALLAGNKVIQSSLPTASRELSAIRRWLGDEAAGAIVIFGDGTSFPTVCSLFPEATVVLVEAPPGFQMRPDAPPREIVP